MDSQGAFVKIGDFIKFNKGRSKPQIGVCPLGVVPLSAALYMSCMFSDFNVSVWTTIGGDLSSMPPVGTSLELALGLCATS